MQWTNAQSTGWVGTTQPKWIRLAEIWDVLLWMFSGKNKEEIEHFLFSCTTLPGAHPTQPLNLQTPIFFNKMKTMMRKKVVMPHNLPFAGRLFVWWTTLEHDWDYAAPLVLYIFAGSTSHVGLSAARLTGSFFRTQHTELKEKRVCVGNCTQSSICGPS